MDRIAIRTLPMGAHKRAWASEAEVELTTASLAHLRVLSGSAGPVGEEKWTCERRKQRWTLLCRRGDHPVANDLGFLSQDQLARVSLYQFLRIELRTLSARAFSGEQKCFEREKKLDRMGGKQWV